MIGTKANAGGGGGREEEDKPLVLGQASSAHTRPHLPSHLDYAMADLSSSSAVTSESSASEPAAPSSSPPSSSAAWAASSPSQNSAAMLAVHGSAAGGGRECRRGDGQLSDEGVGPSSSTGFSRGWRGRSPQHDGVHRTRERREGGGGGGDGDAGELQSRRMTAWQMAGITAIAAGVQFGWALQLSLLTPYVQTLGIPHAWASFVWLCGPISGLLVQPVVGVWSDRCTHPWGRRRPFLVVGALLIALAVVLIGWSADVGAMLGDSVTSTAAGGTRPMACVVFVLGFWCLDLSNNTVQGPSRALLADLAGPNERDTVNSWYSLWVATGSVLGYATGANGAWYRVFPFLLTDACGIPCANLKAAFLLDVLLLALCTAVTCLSAREKPLHPAKALELTPILLPSPRSSCDDVSHGLEPQVHRVRHADKVSISSRGKGGSSSERASSSNEDASQRAKSDIRQGKGDRARANGMTNGVQGGAEFEHVDIHEGQGSGIQAHDSDGIRPLTKQPVPPAAAAAAAEATAAATASAAAAAAAAAAAESHQASLQNRQQDAAVECASSQPPSTPSAGQHSATSSPSPSLSPSSSLSTSSSPPPSSLSLFGDIVRALENMSSGMRMVLLVMALTWMAWFPFLLFDTDWMGRELYHGDPNAAAAVSSSANSTAETQAEGATESSLDAGVLYEQGVHEGAFGLLLFSVVQGITSAFLGQLCRRFQPAIVWAAANALMFLCLAATTAISAAAALPPSSWHQTPTAAAPAPAPLSVGLAEGGPSLATQAAALSVFAALGAPFAVTLVVPFSITAACSEDAGTGQGLSMGILNLAIVFPQVVVAVLAGPWDALFGEGNSPAFAVAAVFALSAAAIAATSLPRQSRTSSDAFRVTFDGPGHV